MKLMEPKFSYKIESKRIYLRPILITEINDKYINWLNNHEVNKFLETKEATKKSIIKYINDLRKLNLDLFAIFENKTKKHIGNFSITSLKKNSACYGLMIGDREARLKGLGGDASLCIIKLLFENLSINSIEVSAYNENEGACLNLMALNFKIIKKNKIATKFKLDYLDWKKGKIHNSIIGKGIKIIK